MDITEQILIDDMREKISALNEHVAQLTERVQQLEDLAVMPRFLQNEQI